MKRFLLSISLLSALSAPLRADDAADVIRQSGVKGGFVVHVGCGDGKTTAALKANDSYQVQGLTKDAASVASVRESIRATGGYGAVSVEQWDGKGLPYIENVVNLLVVEDAASVAKEEIDRVLTPNGVAMVRKGGAWEKIVKPRPADMDDWTHYYYDSRGNATSQDKIVGPPNRMQWVGSPRWSRHHDRMSSVSAMVSGGGRLFYIMDEGSRISILMPAKFALIARDAFNGTVLWKKSIPEWSTHLWPLKSGPTQLTRRLVSDGGDKVFVTLGIADPVRALDGATGEVLKEYTETKGAEEIMYRDGVLYVLANKEPWRLNEEFAVKQQSDQKRVETEFNWDGKPRNFFAIDAASGKVLWQKDGKIAPITLCTDGKVIAYHDGDDLVCLDAKTGAQKWAGNPAKKRNLYEFNYGPRVLIHDSVVLYAGGDGAMKGVDINTGKDLWAAPHEKSGYRSPEDLIVAQGLVWNAGTTSGNLTGEFKGRDIVTGEVKKSFMPDVPEGTYWFHHRCYIAKATENYIIPSRTGIEYVDMAKEHWDLNHWVRGACLYGVLPANGLTYAGPHNCACYPEAKLDGMNALAPTAKHALPAPTPDGERLVKGPAYADAVEEIDPDAKDWPTYRHDNARSGFSDQPLASDLGTAWEAKLTAPLSTVTIAGGLAFVSEVDRHTLHAFDAANGKEAWHFIADARVDSPPTYWKGRVFFGGKDGFVYCLRAKDGALVWKYQAAPSLLRHFAWEQCESVWPVHGSVLVENGLVSCVAGRSCFLDGGLWFYRLDAKTGEMKVKQNYDDKDPDTGGDLNDMHKTLQMPVALNDILSSDGKWTFLRTQKIAADGKRIDIAPVSGEFDKQGGAQKGEGQHLFAPMGFLDDSWFHRSYWVYGKSFAGGHAGYYQAGKYAPAGRILVHDDKNVYSYGREAQYYKWTTTMEHTLYATPKDSAVEAFTTEEATTPRVGNSAVVGDKAQKTVATDANGNPAVKPSGPSKGAKANAQAAKANAKAAKAKGEPMPGSVLFPDVPALDPSKTALTVEAWVFPDSPNGTVMHHGGPRVGVMLDIKDKKPRFHVRADGEHVTSIVSAEQLIDGWHHVVGTLADDGAMTLYINGKQVASGKSTGLVASKPANGLYLGNGNGVIESSEGGFSGLIDQFAIYHKALSAADVQTRFEHPDSRPDGAALYCSFDNGDSRDASGNNAHGVGAGVETGKGKVGAALWFKSASGGGKGGNKGGGSFVKHTWDRYVPIVTRSMALAGKTLFVSGPPDTIDEEYAFERLAAKDKEILNELAEQDAALDGKRGAKMWAVNIETGEQSGGLDLDSPPVWDGMAIAQGRVYVATVDGRLKCFGKK